MNRIDNYRVDVAKACPSGLRPQASNKLRLFSLVLGIDCATAMKGPLLTAK